MKLTLKRVAREAAYTIGHLYIDGKKFCDTCEDRDRRLYQGMPLDTLKAIKVNGLTAIPTGTYEITLDVVSPRFARKAAYKPIGGKLPRLLNVPGYEGVLIHIGNTAEDTEGCILVGKNSQKGKVLSSTDTFFKLYDKLSAAAEKGEKIYIHICS